MATQQDTFILRDDMDEKDKDLLSRILGSVPTSVIYPANIYGIPILAFYYLFSKLGIGKIDDDTTSSDSTVLQMPSFQPKDAEKSYLAVGFPAEELQFSLEITDISRLEERVRHNTLSFEAVNDGGSWDYFSMHIEKGELIFNDGKSDKPLVVRSNLYTFYNKVFINKMQNEVIATTSFLLKVIKF